MSNKQVSIFICDILNVIIENKMNETFEIYLNIFEN